MEGLPSQHKKSENLWHLQWHICNHQPLICFFKQTLLGNDHHGSLVPTEWTLRSNVFVSLRVDRCPFPDEQSQQQGPQQQQNHSRLKGAESPQGCAPLPQREQWRQTAYHHFQHALLKANRERQFQHITSPKPWLCASKDKMIIFLMSLPEFLIRKKHVLC